VLELFYFQSHLLNLYLFFEFFSSNFSLQTQIPEDPQTESCWITQPAKGATSIARLNQTKAQLKRFLKINMYGNHWGRASCDPVPPAQPAPGSAQICNSFKRATKSLQAVCSALFNSRGLYSIYTSLWQIQYLVENDNKYYIVPTILCWSNFINWLIKISNHF